MHTAYGATLPHAVCQPHSTDWIRSRSPCFCPCAHTPPFPGLPDGLLSSSSSTTEYDLTLGVAQRLDTGGLIKARVKHNGQLSLLYQQAVTGIGQVGLTCSLDPLQLNKVAPSVGVALTL